MNDFPEEKSEIRFQVKPIIKKYFELAIAELGIDEEEAFEQLTRFLVEKSTRRGNGQEDDRSSLGLVYRSRETRENFLPTMRPYTQPLTEAAVERRIYKWANNPEGMPRQMIRAFLMVYIDMYGDDGKLDRSVDRLKVCFRFREMTHLSEEKFRSYLAQMCSNSSRAYGGVFCVSRSRPMDIDLKERFRQVILENKENFLADKDNRHSYI